MKLEIDLSEIEEIYLNKKSCDFTIVDMNELKKALVEEAIKCFVTKLYED